LIGREARAKLREEKKINNWTSLGGKGVLGMVGEKKTMGTISIKKSTQSDRGGHSCCLKETSRKGREGLISRMGKILVKGNTERKGETITVGKKLSPGVSFKRKA